MARDGFQTVGAGNPSSGPFRAAARQAILDLAAQGKLTVPIGATFPLSDARRAVVALAGKHPYGKLALVPKPRRDPTQKSMSERIQE